MYSFVRHILSLLYRLPRFSITAVLTAVVLLLTLLPASNIPDVQLFLHADKVVHALMFGAVASALLIDWSRGRCGRIGLKLVAACAVLATLSGIGIEALQSTMAVGRAGDAADAVADACGAFFMPACLLPYLKRFQDE